jgi:hypothetical protein
MTGAYVNFAKHCKLPLNPAAHGVSVPGESAPRPVASRRPLRSCFKVYSSMSESPGALRVRYFEC